MWSFLRTLFSGSKTPKPPTRRGDRKFVAKPRIETEIRLRSTSEEIPAHRATPDWDALPSKEKIQRVPIEPLPFGEGHLLDTGSKSGKKFTVRVTKQKPGAFEFDEQKSINVLVIARGKQAALNAVAEKITGHAFRALDPAITVQMCGGWYDGNMTRLEIISTERTL